MASKFVGDVWEVTEPDIRLDKNGRPDLRPCKVNYQPGFRFHLWCDGEHGPAALVEDERGQVSVAEPASSIQFTDRQ